MELLLTQGGLAPLGDNIDLAVYGTPSAELREILDGFRRDLPRAVWRLPLYG